MGKIAQRTVLKTFIIRMVCTISRPWQTFKLNSVIRKNSGQIFLNLGAGGRNLNGWINIDYNFRTRPDIILDLTRKLPVPDGSVRLIFTEDSVECLTKEQGKVFLSEIHRILAAGGALRTLCPDLGFVVKQYIEHSPETLAWYKDSFGADTASDILNFAMRGMEHKYLYDEEALRRALENLDYEVKKMPFGESDVREFRGIDMRKGSLIMEAIKKEYSVNSAATDGKK